MPQQLHRVVVTGIGSVTPYGEGNEKLWQGLTEQPPAIRRITLFDPSDLPVQIAAEVDEFDPLNYMDKKAVKRSLRYTQFAIAAARMALDDASWSPDRDEEVGVYLGTAGGLYEVGEQAKRLKERGAHHVDPLFVTRVPAHMGAARIGSTLGLRGPNTTINSACASGLDAVSQAVNTLRLGHAEAILAGGAESVIHPIAIASLGRVGAMTRSFNDDPVHASRPFDLHRDGFVIGEGAGILLLETLAHARARDAHIYCEVIGTGWSFDAADDTAPDKEGQLLAVQRAVQDAGIDPSEIDAVKAHATSTVLNDKTETTVLKALLGERAYRVPVTAPKSKLGHSASAAGGVEAVVAVLMLHHQTLIPTANLETPDPECDLDYVREGARPASLRTMLLNSFGMGGQNASVILRKTVVE